MYGPTWKFKGDMKKISNHLIKTMLTRILTKNILSEVLENVWLITKYRTKQCILILLTLFCLFYRFLLINSDDINLTCMW